MLVKPRLRQFWSWFKSFKSIDKSCATARREVAAATVSRRRFRGINSMRRSFSFQSLEPRRVLASDIGLTDFSANGTNLLVSYDIAAETAPAFNLSIYRTSDGVTRDALVGTREVAREAERTVGAHTIEITPDFLDVREDYRLIAVADPAGVIAEASEDNNEKALRGGAFRTPDGIVHVHGTDIADSVRIDAAAPANGSGSAHDSITVRINDASIDYDATTVAEIHLRLHDGDDVLNVQRNITHNIHAFAGAGNDRILAGAGSDWLVGGAGDDFIAGRSNRDLIHGDDDWQQGGHDTLLGGADNDTLEGFAGNDKLLGGRGLDITSGGEGDDIVDGGNDDDLVWSGKGRDRIVNPYGRNEARDARSEDTMLASTPEELIFAELAATQRTMTWSPRAPGNQRRTRTKAVHTRTTL